MLVASTEARPRGALIDFESSIFSGGAEVIWTRENEDQVLLSLRFVSFSRLDPNALPALLEPFQDPG